MHGAVRSSAAYRVRIALNLKVVAFREIFLDMVGGEHRRPEYLTINPQGLVPTLVCPDGTRISQSLAILEYLEEAIPRPALLPAGPADRARVRSIAMAIACDIHPVNNMRLRNHVKALLPDDPNAVAAWTAKWIHAGFAGIEADLARDARTGQFCHGDAPTVADVCLVPQVFNARAMDVDLTAYPTIVRIATACDALPAFAAAHPERIEHVRIDHGDSHELRR